MNAPDYQTIFNVEDAVEDAVKAVLAGVDIKGFTQRETADLPRERVDIQLRLGAQRGHRSMVTPGQWCRDSWDAQLVFNVFTERLESDGAGQRVPVPRERHGKLRGGIRFALEYFAAKFTEELLPFHVLVSLEQQNTDPTVNVEDDLDVSSLHYAVLVGIRAGTWPA